MMAGTLVPFSTVLTVAARGAVAAFVRWDGSATAQRNAAEAVAADRVRAGARAEAEKALAALAARPAMTVLAQPQERLPA